MNRVSPRLLAHVVILLAFLLSACGGGASPAEPAFSSTTHGQVKGSLVDKATNEPVAATVNLVPVIDNGDGTVSYSADLLKTHSVPSVESADGTFLFESVLPGDYMITINVNGGMPLNLKNAEGGQILLKVEIGKVIDLGALPVEK